MRIAVFTNEFPSRISTFFARDVRVLLEQGFDVDVYAFYPLDERLWKYVPDVLNERVFARTKVYHCGLREVLRLAAVRQWEGPSKAARISLSEATRGLRPFLKTVYVLAKGLVWSQTADTRGYDHVLAYWGNYAATSAYLFHALMNRRVPFTMFLHSGVDLYDHDVFMREKLLYADNIVVVCDYNRQFLRSHYPDVFSRIAPKIHHYQPGLDLEELPCTRDGRLSRRILAVGNLTSYKGFDVLLRSTRVLLDRGVACDVHIIGSGKEHARLTRLAAALRITERVAFRGQLPFEAVRSAMSEATILVHPSHGVGDAVPTVIKEAMALGLPVIASDLAGIPELLDQGRCGRLVPPGGVDALADSMHALLTDGGLRAHYAAAARRHAEHHFDLWKNGTQLAAILRPAPTV